MTERNDVDCTLFGCVENETGIKISFRSGGSHACHHLTKVMQLIRHGEISDSWINLRDYDAVISSKSPYQLS